MSKLCTVEGCENVVAYKGICQLHHARLRRTGTTDKIDHSLKVKIKPKCSVEGCVKVSVTKGLCDTHYSRMKRLGVLEIKNMTNKNVQCSVDGCDNNANSRTLCDKHLMRYYRSPSYLASKKQK